jgi:hypothetical protein
MMHYFALALNGRMPGRQYFRGGRWSPLAVRCILKIRVAFGCVRVASAPLATLFGGLAAVVLRSSARATLRVTP